MNVILASASPRRQQLLAAIGLAYTVVVSEIEEDNTKAMRPEELAEAHAVDKAVEVSRRVSPQAIVIGADTIVVVDGKVFGKPQNRDEAIQMLTTLAGREHLVISGVAVVQGTTVVSGYSTTKVTFRQVSPAQIERYVDSGEPMDKAGAYAIQGRGTLLVEGISGCYNNVVGLPLGRLAELLQQIGVDLL